MRLFRHVLPALVAGSLSGLAVAGEPAAAGALEVFRAEWMPFLGRFHPVVLHLPIGVMFALACVEFLLLFRRNQSMQGAAVLLCTLGFLTSGVAALFGYFLYLEGGYGGEDMKWHMYTGYAVAGSAFLVWVWRLISLDPEHGGRRLFYRLLLLGNLAIMGVAGHFGGNITHGSDFLTEHMPESVRAQLAKVGWKEGGEPSAASGTNTNTTAVSETLYAAAIAPLFEARCVSCHGESKQKGDYRLDTPGHLVKAGESEKAPIVAGKPGESYLVELITLPESDEDVMPPEGKSRLTPEHIALVRWWVEHGNASFTLTLAEAALPADLRAAAATAKTLKKDASKKAIASGTEAKPAPAPAVEKPAEPAPATEKPAEPKPESTLEKPAETKPEPAPAPEKSVEAPAPPAPAVESPAAPKAEPAPVPEKPAEPAAKPVEPSPEPAPPAGAPTPASP